MPRNNRIPPPWIERRFIRRGDFGASLQGLGSPQTQALRAFPGSTFGAASPCRRLSRTEREGIEAQMRRDGKL